MGHPNYLLPWNIITEVWKIIFLSKGVIFRFQPLIFRGSTYPTDRSVGRTDVIYPGGWLILVVDDGKCR